MTDTITATKAVENGAKKPKTPEYRPLADLGKMRVRRDTRGALVPFRVDVMSCPFSVMMVPLRMGFVRTLPEELHTKPVGDWPIEYQVKFVKELVIEPDMASVTAQDVLDNWDPETWNSLIVTLNVFSGPVRENMYEDPETSEGNRKGSDSTQS